MARRRNSKTTYCPLIVEIGINATLVRARKISTTKPIIVKSGRDGILA
jgi:hypothetical protein